MKAKEQREAEKAAVKQKEFKIQGNVNHVFKMIKEEQEKENLEKKDVATFRNELDEFQDAVKQGQATELDETAFEELRKRIFLKPDAFGVEHDRWKALCGTEEQILGKLSEVAWIGTDGLRVVRNLKYKFFFLSLFSRLLKNVMNVGEICFGDISLCSQKLCRTNVLVHVMTHGSDLHDDREGIEGCIEHISNNNEAKSTEHSLKSTTDAPSK